MGESKDKGRSDSTMLYKVSVLLAVFLQVYGQCPSGWTQHKNSCCFLHFHDKYDWVESKGFCEGHNAHLAYIEDAEENTFAKGLMQAQFQNDLDSDPHVWIGGDDEIEEGKWVWYKIEQPVTFTDWGPGEPNSDQFNEIEDCLVYWADYGWKWADLDCHEENFFLCEKSATSVTEIIG